MYYFLYYLSGNVTCISLIIFALSIVVHRIKVGDRDMMHDTSVEWHQRDECDRFVNCYIASGKDRNIAEVTVAFPPSPCVKTTRHPILALFCLGGIYLIGANRDHLHTLVSSTAHFEGAAQLSRFLLFN